MKCINPTYAQQYIDGELGIEAQIVLKQHLDECIDCSKLVSEQEQKGFKVIRTINQLSSQEIAIPPFKKPKKQKSIRKEKVALILNIATIAAAITLLILMFPFNKNNNTTEEIGYVEHRTEEIDANKPITAQDISIIVIDPSGQQEQFTIN